jgi:hypothetical protein
MTAPHEWNPVPATLSVRCPECRNEAAFEFPSIVRIQKLKDVPLFRTHAQLQYTTLIDHQKRKWHAAVLYPGLNARDWTSLRNLPEGYAAASWNPSNQIARTLPSLMTDTPTGCLRCQNCQIARRHNLNWPDAAWFQISHGKELLWAWHRDCAADLRDFIRSRDRDPHKHQWYLFLLHIPEAFLQAKSRSDVLKKLDRLLKPNLD